MGCRDEGRAGEEYAKECDELRVKLDSVTAMPCEVLYCIERQAAERKDRKERLAAETLRLGALSKLTAEEKKVLGLK